MTQKPRALEPRDEVGLCATCRHSRQVRTPRSTFWLCGLAATDPSFEKYPRLPIRVCPGYSPAGSGDSL